MPIKVGFVGLSTTGWASMALGPALLDPSLKETYKLTALSTSNAQSASAAADKYTLLAGNPVKDYHGSSSSIAHDDDVDLVAVSVKAPLHVEAVSPVIESGKDFFLEWPAGRNLRDTEEIRQRASRAGVKTFIGLQGRSSGAIRKVKQLIDSGAIGKVLSSTYVAVSPKENIFYAPSHRASARYALDPENGVTPLIITTGHQLDAITHVLGPFTSVTAAGSQLYPQIKLVADDGVENGETVRSQFDDHFTFSGTLQSGAHSTFVMRHGGKSFEGRKTLRWEIDGEDGHILVESEFGLGAFMNIASPKVYLNGKEVDVEGVQGGTYDAVGILVDQWKEYAKGEKEGKYATIDDAVRNRRVLDAVEKSAREGKRVDVDLKLGDL